MEPYSYLTESRELNYAEKSLLRIQKHNLKFVYALYLSYFIAS